MDIVNFTLRLLKHGSIFLLKLLGSVIGLAGGAMASTQMPEERGEYGVHPDGPPWQENTAHEQWEASYGGKR
jgi:hypothetical protein